jgi:hypothetical protein
MGCDIHSRAEIRINGKWQMLGEVFPNLSRIRWFVPDREYLEASSDGVLIDTIDTYVKARRENDNYEVPEIPVGSLLEKKILYFARMRSEKAEWGREKGRKAIQTDENGEYDPDGWTRWSREVVKKLGEEAALTSDERESIIQAILNFRYQEEDEGDVRDNRITVTEHKTEEDDMEWWQSEPLDARNYTLFAYLAGVRNYQDVTPISEPKGAAKHEQQDGEWVHVEGDFCPSDASSEAKKFMDSYSVDGHSHSWLTLAELEAWGVDEEIEFNGWVNDKTYWKLVEAGYERGGTVGPAAYYYERVDDDGYFKATNQVFWRGSKSDMLGQEFRNMIQIFRQLKEEKDISSDDIRVLFFFDN